MTIRLPTYFLSHGGGPWTHMKPQLGGMYDTLEASLQDIPRQLGHAKPRAVLVVSGHWEEDDFSVMSGARPPMIYDYQGFPAHTYEIRYDAPGSPEVAARVRELLVAAGLPARLDGERGYDHGTFVPLYAIYPDADVPVLELSLKRGYDPQTHLAAGRALAPLREEGVLVVGSGLSYHNLRRMDPSAHDASKAFDDWLHAALSESDPQTRRERLISWQRAPAARVAHPHEDHLIPLMMAAGAAESETAHRIYHEDAFFGGVAVSSYRFGAEVARAGAEVTGTERTRLEAARAGAA
ncbi:MAG: DODA-type extradiol aromatic ring-opening family dioxygenase [Burkholderiales bacterium]